MRRTFEWCYAAESAQEVLSIFEESHPGDRRPRLAVEAAWTFAEGAKRTKLQRTSAFAAHKAAREARTDAARDAARAAGHAAAAAYLHPLARSTQVKHNSLIVRDSSPMVAAKRLLEPP